MNRMISALAGAILLSGWLASGSQIASLSDHQPLSDGEIRKLVEHALLEMDILDVKVDVSGGAVTLNGAVASLWAKEEASDLARNVHDVLSVVNNIVETPGPGDVKIAQDLRRQIGQYVFYTIYDDVELSVSGGAVRLYGSVTAPYKAREIENLAKRVPGVREVKNEIATLSESSFDDELRTSIASRIYRDPTFWSYGIQVNPPIHIIVDKGHVTLRGAVRWDADRREAELIARSTFGVASVDNQLRIES